MATAQARQVLNTFYGYHYLNLPAIPGGGAPLQEATSDEIDLAKFIEYHELYDVAETTDGGFLAVGRSADFSGTEEVPTQGWLLKVDEYGCLVPGCQLVSATEEPAVLPQLLLYPNPVEDVLNVYLGPWTNEKEVTFRVVDVQGKVWQKRRATVADATYLLPVDQLSAGAYFLQLVDASGQVLVSEQFIKT